MKIKFNADDWNGKNLIIDGKHYDVNLYADDDDQVRVIIMECEVGEMGIINNRKTIYDEAFDIGVEIVQDRPDTPDIDSIAERNYENRRT
jgi:hypothetical protein